MTLRSQNLTTIKPSKYLTLFYLFFPIFPYLKGQTSKNHNSPRSKPGGPKPRFAHLTHPPLRPKVHSSSQQPSHQNISPSYTDMPQIYKKDAPNINKTFISRQDRHLAVRNKSPTTLNTLLYNPTFTKPHYNQAIKISNPILPIFSYFSLFKRPNFKNS